MARKRKQGGRTSSATMPVMRPDAAGIDIGSLQLNELGRLAVADAELQFRTADFNSEIHRAIPALRLTYFL